MQKGGNVIRYPIRRALGASVDPGGPSWNASLAVVSHAGALLVPGAAQPMAMLLGIASTRSRPPTASSSSLHSLPARLGIGTALCQPGGSHKSEYRTAEKPWGHASARTSCK